MKTYPECLPTRQIFKEYIMLKHIGNLSHQLFVYRSRVQKQRSRLNCLSSS